MSGWTVLSVNAGSSSLKVALYAMDAEERLMARGEAWGIDSADGGLRLRNGKGQLLISEELLGATHADAFHRFADILDPSELPSPDVVGHRLVHGGAHLETHSPITPELLAQLREIVPLAPLHLPTEIALIEQCNEKWPEVTQAVCFDTAFHRGTPEVAQRLPLPRQLHTQGVQRYGFHGISYEYVISELGEAARGRVIVAHLGAGASLAAVHGGEPVDTTMSMTPAGGLMMATRCGDLDPGVLIHLMAQKGYDPAAIERLVNRESGLFGVSGSSGDMRSLLEADDGQAQEAVDLFCYIARKHIGAMAAALGGVDTLVFTAGIGERSPEVRSRICGGLAYLGAKLDETRNARNEPLISSPQATCEVRVIPTNEELMVARHAVRLVKSEHSA